MTWIKTYLIAWFNDFVLRETKNFKKFTKAYKKNFLAKTKKYVSYYIEWLTKLPCFKDFDEPSENKLLRE
jgi:hypothetical protein